MTRDAAIKHRLAYNAFCDGATIEMRQPDGTHWTPTEDPGWLPDWHYRVRCNMTEVDAEDLIAACVPGGGICDPQTIADNIRAYCRERGQR